MAEQNLGLYVHWPFCVSKCPYCDFNSHVRASIDEGLWKKALMLELETASRELKHHKLSSIFFGGGTPSLMAPATVEAVIQKAFDLWGENQIEITLEANPNSIEANKFSDFKAAGVNRVSIGVQSLINEQLKFLGRAHGKEEAINAIKLAAKIFNRYSFDLIYARPEQTIAQWKNELEEALQYTDSHMSLYQLTIEPGTSFYTRHKRGEIQIPDDDLAADMYFATAEIMDKAGLASYEVSNYAKPGQESQHNLIYWRYQDFLGVGPGAHGRITINGEKVAEKRIRGPELWIESVTNLGHGTDERIILNHEDQFAEWLMMGLRLKEGVDQQTLLNKVDIRKFVESGHLIAENGRVKPTDLGIICLNAVIGKILDLSI